MIAAAIYMLCALTALACCVLLLRAWLRSRAGMLFWSWLCFAGLTLSNMLLVADKLVFPLLDLNPARVLVSVVAVGLLVYGLIWEER